MNERYIAVQAVPVSIIKKCNDRSCNKYHGWVTFTVQVGYHDAAEIARAMNKVAELEA